MRCGGNTCEENTEQSVQNLFDRWAVDGSADRAMQEHEYAVRQVLDNWVWNPTDHYLDIGCGNGYSLRIVAPYVPKGQLVGVDLSGRMIEKAREETRLSVSVKFHVSSFREWEGGQNRFDKIFSMETFYYFEDVPCAIRKAYELLKPGGVFACIVDYYEENPASWDWPKPEKCGVPMQRFNKKEWEGMFLDAGFRDVRQWQIRCPPAIASEPWQAETGSLVTEGGK